MYQQYDSAVRAVLDSFDKNGMSKTVRKYFRHDVRVLKEYLEQKGLEYSCPVAQAWLAAAKPALTRIALPVVPEVDRPHRGSGCGMERSAPGTSTTREEAPGVAFRTTLAVSSMSTSRGAQGKVASLPPCRWTP